MDGLDGTDRLEQIDGWGIPLPKSCITYFILFLFFISFPSLLHTQMMLLSLLILHFILSSLWLAQNCTISSSVESKYIVMHDV